MEYSYDQAVEILRRTPSTLNALLSGLPDVWTRSTAGLNTWSVYDIVRHLLNGDQNDWMGRVQFLLEHGEGHPFPVVDRTAMRDKYKDASLEQLLDAFAGARSQSLEALQKLNITPEMLTRKGTHAVFGTVTLSQLLSTWVVHDLNHTGQIVEVMAHQYTDAVGPWIAYLGILTRPVLTE